MIPCHRDAPTGASLSIAACGARPGADAPLATTAIQTAIDRCAAAGGGTVVVPAGIWRTGALRLASDITLHLCEGAVLRGSDDWRDYGSGRWSEALLTAAEDAAGTPLPDRREPADAGDIRTVMLAFSAGFRPVLLRGVGLELVVG